MSPLVLGQISPLGAGIAVAVTCAASFVVDLLFFGLSGPSSGVAGTVALAGGYAGLAFYDAFSKRLAVPLVADAVQGFGWACLVWYGGVRASGATAATLLAALFVVGFVVIVNGGVAWSLQGALALLALLSPLGVRGGFGLWAVWYLLCLAATATAVLLLREELRSADRTQRFRNLGAAHMLAVWLPLSAMTAMYGGLGQGLIALLVMVLPMLGNGEFRTALRAMPSVVTQLTSAPPRPTRAAESPGTDSAATQSSGADHDAA